MKRLFLAVLLLAVVLLSSCEKDATLSKIGSADGPTAIIVSGK